MKGSTLHRSGLTREKMGVLATFTQNLKKQSAKIPNSIKNRLTKAVDEAMDLAIKAQTYRGRIAKIDEEVDYIWDRIQDRDQFLYRINRNSRIFDLIKEKVDDETWSRIDMVLEEIENAVLCQNIKLPAEKTVDLVMPTGMI